MIPRIYKFSPSWAQWKSRRLPKQRANGSITNIYRYSKTIKIQKTPGLFIFVSLTWAKNTTLRSIYIHFSFPLLTMLTTLPVIMLFSQLSRIETFSFFFSFFFLLITSVLGIFVWMKRIDFYACNSPLANAVHHYGDRLLIAFLIFISTRCTDCPLFFIYFKTLKTICICHW